ncbi:hypothetical protein AK830_g9416 [Neonectria ditissima]|uniref:Uncharacterized protein n=1 Tax=Neonectria ditissima TaxID=78410 RepID=A0A0P7B9W6_9HYPO|nr:hypothetical protein AK830_g9416 [Neonectria ditissima]
MSPKRYPVSKLRFDSAPGPAAPPASPAGPEPNLAAGLDSAPAQPRLPQTRTEPQAPAANEEDGEEEGAESLPPRAGVDLRGVPGDRGWEYTLAPSANELGLAWAVLAIVAYFILKNI